MGTIGEYLLHSYLYYILDQPVIPDEEYDKICKDLYEKWDEINHLHKHLVSKDDLKAGTGYSLTIYDYPKNVKTFADELLRLRAVGRDYLQELKDTYGG